MRADNRVYDAVKKGSAAVKTCSLAAASTVRRIIAEYAAAYNIRSNSMRRGKRGRINALRGE
jgi:hypothetical protein